MPLQERLLLQSGRGLVSVPGLAWSGPLLPGIPGSRYALAHGGLWLDADITHQCTASIQTHPEIREQTAALLSCEHRAQKTHGTLCEVIPREPLLLLNTCG